jgi:hypothetical protein
MLNRICAGLLITAVLLWAVTGGPPQGEYCALDATWDALNPGSDMELNESILEFFWWTYLPSGAACRDSGECGCSCCGGWPSWLITLSALQQFAL